MEWKIKLDKRSRLSEEGEEYTVVVVDNPTYGHFRRVQQDCRTMDASTGLYVEDSSKELAALASVLLISWDLPFDIKDPDSWPVTLAVYFLARLRMYIIGEEIGDPFGQQ